ncbi:hypothetical protein K2173_008013 [Erythroxylum novogranatense]|uniref:Uncharacterized protein n=1 Tax=Erythroxylum novogranatense TaxID=1862640 RepID=A0AAV8T8B3_9ROSI|nr:hypothetical protein K2173_008013 [Erythroxylum novogranatense]
MRREKTVEARREFNLRREELDFFFYGGGLNRELDEVRGRILSRCPLSLMREAFVEVHHGESRWQVMLKENEMHESSTLAACGS